MVQEFDYPKSEKEFHRLRDKFYEDTRKCIEKGELPKFKGLLEIISSEVVILTAIHKIKANKGSNTPGSDGKVMRKDFLEKDYESVILQVQESLKGYKPSLVLRKWIPKPGKTEKRPLGIPTINDRIIQECVRSVIEPILEAQFFKHSYGFRPWRDTHMAFERVKDQVQRVNYYWIVEGDISKFFDNVNHRVLLKKLWNMGIRDQRVLMIIKQMLQAGIMGEMKRSQIGTPQGGIISPLLANVYLHKLDKWIVREWEEKKTQFEYSTSRNRYQSLNLRSNLKPAYLVRYADDWVLITNTKSNAEKWKRRIAKYLETNLKLKLSEEKTLLSNIKERPIHFVGFQYKVVKDDRMKFGYKPSSSVIEKRVKSKIDEIHKNIRDLQGCATNEDVVNGITRINAKIRGLVQYYQPANKVYFDFKKYSRKLIMAGYKSLKKYGGEFVPAKEVANLPSVHANYTTTIPAIKVGEQWVGLTDISFCMYQKIFTKNPEETPYTEKGREIHRKRTKKKSPLARADEMFQSTHLSTIISMGKTSKLYNFEYYLNRPYAFNRDKGKCRICGKEIYGKDDLHMHHIKPYLPLDQVNRVGNIATTHNSCHKMIHDNVDYSHLGNKTWKKIKDFREKLRQKNSK